MCIRDRYIPGRKNTAADVLSRINIQQQTFEGEKEQLVKVYNIIKNRICNGTFLSIYWFGEETNINFIFVQKHK